MNINSPNSNLSNTLNHRMACWSGTSSKLLNKGRGYAPALFVKRGERMENELKSGLIPVVRADHECDVYCSICHKLLHVEEGQVIPRCCGKIMQPLD